MDDLKKSLIEVLWSMFTYNVSDLVEQIFVDNTVDNTDKNKS